MQFPTLSEELDFADLVCMTGMYKGRGYESMDTYICVDRSSVHTPNFMPETTDVQNKNEGNWQDIMDSKIFINLESFNNVKLC